MIADWIAEGESGSVERIDLEDCGSWTYSGHRLVHSTGRFFSVGAVRYRGENHILIDQPEVGILGFLVFDEPDSRSWLLQKKREPGNDPFFQISPTVQATQSNYKQVHGGQATKYLEYFLDADAEFISDVEGSEQGSKFREKFNRNVVAAVEGPTKPAGGEYFRWVSSQELKDLLGSSNCVNTDARTVIASSSWGGLVDRGSVPFETMADAALADLLRESLATARPGRVESLCDSLKASLADQESIDVPFDEAGVVADSTGMSIDGADRIGFFDINFSEREVPGWQQPLWIQEHRETMVLALQERDGVVQALVSRMDEPGFNGRMEFGPSFQTGHGGGKVDESAIDMVMSKSKTIASIRQGDEGGRFYRTDCYYSVVLLQDSISEQDHEWVTLGELATLANRSAAASHELRIACSVLLSQI